MQKVKVRRELHNNSYYEPTKAFRWEIVVNGKVVEGGFLSRYAANHQAETYRNEKV